MRLRRQAVLKVPGSNAGANGQLGRVLNVGATPLQVGKRLPGVRTKNPRPPGNPTGRGTTTG